MMGEDPSKWYKIHGYASDTVYAQARIWYRLRATLPLVPFTCNPSVSAPPRPVRLPVSLLGCFAGVIVYLYICKFVYSYIFALRGSILRVRIGLKIAPRRGPGGSQELPRRGPGGSRRTLGGVSEPSWTRCPSWDLLGALLGAFLGP